MKPNRISIRIDKPCHEDWDQMTPTDQGRFCGSCQKHVTDFSKMTDNEILEFLSAHTGSMCGQLRGNQLNRVLIATQMSGSKWKLNSWVTALMFAGGAGMLAAQTTPPQNNQTVIIDEKHPTGPVCIRTKTEPVKRELNAMILDTLYNEPMVYATVQLMGTEISAQTNADGDFTLIIPDSITADSITLLISAPGYYRQEYTLAVSDIDKTSRIEVAMNERMMKGEMIIQEPPKKSR